MFRWLAAITLLLSLVLGCNGESIEGRWSMEGNPGAFVVSGDGTFTMEGPEGPHERCREAGFAEAADECAAGRWEATDDGYSFELPAMSMAENETGEIVECRCGFDAFPGQLAEGVLTVDMSSVGGPTVQLTQTE